MRGAGFFSVLIAAVALGLGSSELLAETKPLAVVPSMLARPEVVQLKSAAWDWVRSTATSTPFLIGTAVGILVAEAAHFVLRWLGRTVGFVAFAVNFFVRHRLITASAIAAICYVTAYHVTA